MNLRFSVVIIISIFSFFSCKSSNVRKIEKIKTNYKGKSISTSSGDCVVAYDEFDRLSGNRITELKPEYILSYTHDKLKQYFTDRPFIECNGALSRKGEEYFLQLIFIVDTKYIKTGYNGLSAKSMLRISLINGDKVFVKNIINDLGVRDMSANKVTYKGLFPIAKEDIKILKNIELDKFGVEWNGGVEEYEIYNIDFIIKQFKCLSKVK